MSRVSAKGSGRLVGRALWVPVGAVGAVVVRPRLWATAWRQGRALAAPGSVRPSADYLALRMATQYGDPSHAPEIDDIVSYLEWCRDWRRLVTAAARRHR